MMDERYLRRRANHHLRMAERAPAPYLARLHVELASRYLERIAEVPMVIHRARAAVPRGTVTFRAHPPRIRG